MHFGRLCCALLLTSHLFTGCQDTPADGTLGPVVLPDDEPAAPGDTVVLVGVDPLVVGQAVASAEPESEEPAPPELEPIEPAVDLCLTSADNDPIGWVRFNMDYHSTAGRLEIVGDRAYVADSYGASTAWWLHVLDLSEPGEPALQTTFQAGDKWDGSGAGYDLLVDGNVAYVGTTAGLTVLDISDSDVPEVIATEEGTPLNRLARFSNYLVGDGWAGLVIFDVTTPSTPVVVGKYDIAGGGLVMEGSRAYLVTPDEIVHILDLSAVGAPTLLGWYEGAQWMLGSIAVHKDTLYVVEAVKPDSEPGPPAAFLRAIDVSDPSAPKELDSAPLPYHWTHSLWVADETLYVNTDDGLHRFDITEASTLLSLGPALVGCDGRVTSTQSHLQLACGGQVRMAELPLEPPWGTLPVGIWTGTYDLAVWGDHAYIATGQGVEVVDVSKPEVPAQTALFTGFNGFTTSVLVHDDYLVVGEHPKIRVRSLAADPASPPIVATVDATAGPSSYLETARDALLFTTAQKELGIVDFTDPTNPGPVAWVPLPQEGSGSNDTIARALATENTLAYVGSVTGDITIIDVSNAADPAIAEIVPAASDGRILDIKLTDNRMYVRSLSALDIYDRTTPDAPVFLGAYTELGPGATPDLGWKKDRFAVKGDLVFVTDRSADSNLKVLDVSNPALITTVFTDAFPNGPRTATIAGEWIYITTGEQLTIRKLCDL